MSDKINIAIDGHSSTGKSTSARRLAQELGYLFVDTGAMYRAISYFALRENLIIDQHLNTEKLIKELPGISINFQRNPETHINEVYLNGENVEKEIRTLEVSNVVSIIASVSEVRAKLVEQQQAMGKNKGLVMDGRDIGTVVFPDAELKVFMTAAADVRAQRRYDELKERGDDIDYHQVLENVLERDEIDSTRADSPLRQADDAMLLDTSTMDREQQFEQLMHWANQAILRAAQ